MKDPQIKKLKRTENALRSRFYYVRNRGKVKEGVSCPVFTNISFLEDAETIAIKGEFEDEVDDDDEGDKEEKSVQRGRKRQKSTSMNFFF